MKVKLYYFFPIWLDHILSIWSSSIVEWEWVWDREPSQTWTVSTSLTLRVVKL